MQCNAKLCDHTVLERRTQWSRALPAAQRSAAQRSKIGRR
jgi:hypothetical protein